MASTPYPDLVDYHVHHERCGHAVEPMERYVQSALAKGLGEMGLSDHLYCYWPAPLVQPGDVGMPEERYDEYVTEARALQRAYPQIRLRLAMEVDYIAGYEEQLAKILGQYEWDYLLGSVHFLGDWNFDHARYIDEYDRRDIDEVYLQFWDLLGQAAETGLFDVMTHIDLPKKFGFRPKSDLRSAKQRMVERLARAGVAVEVNTSGLRKPAREIYPALDLLTICREAGVPATLSSDSHHPDEVGCDFDKALEHLERAGYHEYSAFEGRRREMRPLPRMRA